MSRNTSTHSFERTHFPSDDCSWLVIDHRIMDSQDSSCFGILHLLHGQFTLMQINIPRGIARLSRESRTEAESRRIPARCDGAGHVALCRNPRKQILRSNGSPCDQGRVHTLPRHGPDDYTSDAKSVSLSLASICPYHLGSICSQSWSGSTV
jgi:hypothetical protein